MVKDLKMGISSWIIWWAQCDHRGLSRREAGGLNEKEARRCYTAGSEDGG